MSGVRQILSGLGNRMHCPSCNAVNHDKVIDSRLTEGGAAVRRRRMCLKCDRRFTTKERIEEELRLSVVKNDGRRTSYNRDKIVAGIQRAVYKLSISDEDVERLVNRVEGALFRDHDREATTEQIGYLAGCELRKLNAVAYVRFMSIHRKFHTIEEFIDEIRDMRELSAHDIPDQQSLFDGVMQPSNKTEPQA